MFQKLRAEMVNTVLDTAHDTTHSHDITHNYTKLVQFFAILLF